jgi:hypothetical protein
MIADGKLVILAGGISSRMKRKPVKTETLDPKLEADADLKSKSMIGVGEGYRPFLDYLLYNAKQAGYCFLHFIDPDDGLDPESGKISDKYYEFAVHEKGYHSDDGQQEDNTKKDGQDPWKSFLLQEIGQGV